MKLDRHQQLEMSSIGREGMLGVTLILGVNVATLDGIVQGSGSALRMTTAQLKHQLRLSPALMRTLKQYLYSSMVQLSQSIVCIHFHKIGPRLAHCLLRIYDQVQGAQFHFTHELLASMLGVRRSSITVAAGLLQKQKLIHYSRGNIIILNRKGLEEVSCSCYPESKVHF
ncbi:Crp/Fnr family transcriptional regulator [Aliikangiella sp. IMCC44359]|uniref:Crp/Fnr family transcriptional regulator n=1 Tax=Aliikangiella sp. IMCC44359 TaxID=3459125 RepID=UPI00403A8A0C